MLAICMQFCFPSCLYGHCCHCCCRQRYRAIAAAAERGRWWLSAKAMPCKQILLWSLEASSYVSPMILFSQHLPQLYYPSVPHLPPQVQPYVCFYMFCCLPVSNKLWPTALLVSHWAPDEPVSSVSMLNSYIQVVWRADWLATKSKNAQAKIYF